jgi:protein TonB
LPGFNFQTSGALQFQDKMGILDWTTIRVFLRLQPSGLSFGTSGTIRPLKTLFQEGSKLLQASAPGDIFQDRRHYSIPFIWSLAVHIMIAAVMIYPWPQAEPIRVLAQMQFELYDPLGGVPGGGEEAGPDLPPPPESQPEPEPVSEPEPEPIPEEEPPQLIESSSEEAEEAPSPPPPEVKPKAKPKPKPKPLPVQRASAGTSESTGSGQSGTGQAGTGQGGVGGGTGRGNPDALAAYKTRIQRRLERSKKYPPLAQSRKVEGIVYVTFTINKDGRVVSSTIARSSGFSILDDEALGLLRRVNPLPSIPDEVQATVVTLTAPLQFKMR